MLRLSTPLIALAALSFSAAASAQQAPSVLADWTVAGDAASPDGSTLLLTTAFDALDDAGQNRVVGTGAIAAQQPGGVEEQAGLAIGSLDITIDGLLYQATEGSVISRTFAVTAGSTLSFSWQILSNEPAVGGLPDLAFLSLGNQLIALNPAVMADNGFLGFQRSSGWLSFSHTFDAASLGNTAGSVRISLGVVDRGDTSTSTALAIQNVNVSAVPEPTAWGLLLGGLLVTLGSRRLRARG